MNVSSLITKKRIIILFAVIVVVGGFFYFYSSKGSEQVAELGSDMQAVVGGGNSSAFSANGAKTVKLLLELERTTFPRDVLSSAAFTALTDNTVNLTSEEPGRENPFAPIGTGSRPGLKRETAPTSQSNSSSQATVSTSSRATTTPTSTQSNS